MLYPGLYEQVINNALNRELADIPEARKSTAPVRRIFNDREQTASDRIEVLDLRKYTVSALLL